MASPLALQFGFVTWQLPLDLTSAGLPQQIEIVGSIDVSRTLPVDIPLMLVHGWIEQRGDFEFSYRLYDPNGELVPEPVDVQPIKADLEK